MVVYLEAVQITKSCYRLKQKVTTTRPLSPFLWGEAGQMFKQYCGLLCTPRYLGDLGKEIMSAPLVCHSFRPLT